MRSFQQLVEASDLFTERDIHVQRTRGRSGRLGKVRAGKRVRIVEVLHFTGERHFGTLGARFRRRRFPRLTSSSRACALRADAIPATNAGPQGVPVADREDT